MANVLGIADIRSYAAQVAKFYNIKKVSLFGSYANGEQTKDSDIDLLVDFGDTVSIYTIAGVKLKMEALTGKEVDVIATPIPKESILEIDKEIVLYDK